MVTICDSQTTLNYSFNFVVFSHFQGYKLCVLDYEFHILDNAFLVHKPGIKILKKGMTHSYLKNLVYTIDSLKRNSNETFLLSLGIIDSKRDMLVAKTNQLIRKIIYPELKAMYGSRNGCGI